MVKLELRHAEINKKYRKKWNINSNSDDYCYLFKDGKQMGHDLYRIGGMGAKLTESYFMILKYCEACYDDHIAVIEGEKNYLAGHWIIMNQEGKELIIFDQYEHAYLQGGPLYVIGNRYYNVNTGQYYGSSYSSLNSSEFLFINNAYDDDKSKRGILKISKIDGTTELFPKE